MKLAITKENAERILQGMFCYDVMNIVTDKKNGSLDSGALVLFVADDCVWVDTGEEFYGDISECRAFLKNHEALSSAHLKKISLFAGVINERCRSLNIPEWDNWYWGDALYAATYEDGTPTEAVNLCGGSIGWPHQSKDTQGNLLIPKAKVRIIKRIPLK